MFLPKPLLALACGSFLLSTGQIRADVIDFETYTGPSTFGGPEQTLSIPTSIGNVIISGGTILTATSFLPADQTSVYGTASFGGTGDLSTLTLMFPSNITNFFLNVYNGQTYNDTFTVADNMGRSNTVTLAPNTSGGTSLVSFPAVGDIVTISTTDPSWDFFVDNIGFNQPTPNVSPEPSSLGFVGLAGIGAALVGRFRKSQKKA